MALVGSIIAALSFTSANALGNSVPVWVVREGAAPTRLCYNQTWSTGLQGVETCVQLSVDTHALHANFEVAQDPVQQNAFKQCNEDVFNQEVVEVFLASDAAEVKKAKPEKYWEVELTPKGVAWVGYDSNPGGDRTNLTHVLHPCSSVATSVTPRHGAWQGRISLPWKLIGPGAPAGALGAGAHAGRLYRANFFRVQMNPRAWAGRSVTTQDACGPANCTFLCANCPDTKEPDFHHSGFFGNLVVERRKQ